jgi:hypothetical protein
MWSNFGETTGSFFLDMQVRHALDFSTGRTPLGENSVEKVENLWNCSLCTLQEGWIHGQNPAKTGEMDPCQNAQRGFCM